MGLAFEVNKQMCDIGREISIKDKKYMEEKKTRIMTKAEAFEWLKGKKVKCYAGITNLNDEPDKVEKFLKDVGCRYHFANHISWRDWYWPLYGFIVDSKGEIYVAFEDQRDFFEQNPNEPISADDILSIEIVDEKKKSENVSIELEKWIGVIRDKFCCNGWSFVISASNFALFSGDLIEEKRIKE